MKDFTWVFLLLYSVKYRFKGTQLLLKENAAAVGLCRVIGIQIILILIKMAKGS